MKPSESVKSLTEKIVALVSPETGEAYACPPGARFSNGRWVTWPGATPTAVEEMEKFERADQAKAIELFQAASAKLSSE